MKIIVSSLASAPALMLRERPSHLVSLLAPEEIHLAPRGHARARHLRLTMHDLRDTEDLTGDIPPASAHVARLLAFADGWDAKASILVHCWAGVSRSTAAAFAIACARNPDTDETVIARALRKASPTAWPNPMLVAHADAVLDRQGRMIEAIEAIGAPEHFASAPFHLPADFSPRKR